MFNLKKLKNFFPEKYDSLMAFREALREPMYLFRTQITDDKEMYDEETDLEVFLWGFAYFVMNREEAVAALENYATKLNAKHQGIISQDEFEDDDAFLDILWEIISACEDNDPDFEENNPILYYHQGYYTDILYYGMFFAAKETLKEIE